MFFLILRFTLLILGLFWVFFFLCTWFCLFWVYLEFILGVLLSLHLNLLILGLFWVYFEFILGLLSAVFLTLHLILLILGLFWVDFRFILGLFLGGFSYCAPNSRTLEQLRLILGLFSRAMNKAGIRIFQRGGGVKGGALLNAMISSMGLVYLLTFGLFLWFSCR